MSKSERRNRTALLPSIRCFPEEKSVIQEKATAAGLSIGAYMLKCSLGRRIDARCDVELINELRRLGGLQKHLFNEGKGNVSDAFSKQYSDVLIAIKKAIIAIDMDMTNEGDKA
ncbi:plasmid mobilization protein MobA [Serratia nevei]|uniref:plasmid mobilization protein MobA n=1 Tax=Serratia nevei TaxID=2703794 RepID=UPI003FA7DD76